MEEKQKPKLDFGSKKIKCLAIAVIGLLVVVIIPLSVTVANKKSEPEIISKSTLEKIINVSDLATFEAVYNGIAKVF